MALFKRREKGEKGLEDGRYFAVVKDVRTVNGKYGERLRVTFVIFNTEIERTCFMDAWVGQRNLTRKFVEACGVLDKIEEVEAEDLIGKIVEIELRTQEKNGRSFQRVVDIREVKTK